LVAFTHCRRPTATELLREGLDMLFASPGAAPIHAGKIVGADKHELQRLGEIGTSTPL
jgi:hypothetical protein